MRALKLIERRRLLPLTQNDVVDDEKEGAWRWSITNSYKKLAPSPLLKLSVLKLDGSVFEIHVGRTATVAELKQAVEMVFTSCKGKIPWSLIWGHFCLGHIGKKLTNDRAHIRNFGIKDDDQIEFMRHMSISNMPLEKGSKNETLPYKQHLMLSYESNGQKEEVENSSEDLENNVSQEDKSEYHSNRDADEDPVPEFKLPCLWKGWLPYSKVLGGLKKGIKMKDLLTEMPEFLRKRM